MSWNKIDNLLIKIEAFYKKALWSELVIKAQHNDINSAEYLTPKEREKIRLQKERERMSEEAAKWIGKKDMETKVRVDTKAPAPKEVDLGIYPEIVNFIKGIKNINASEKLFEIAELYKETVKNNENPASLYEAIDNFLETTLVDEYSDYDQEDDLEPDTNPKDITPGQAAKLEGLNIEILLREVYADITRRDLLGKETSTSVPAESGAPISETPDDTGREEGGGQDYDRPEMGTAIDPSDIGGKKPREGGGVPSLGVITIRKPKDYVEDYKAQKNRYADQLNDPSISDVIKNNIKENINVLNNLIDVTAKEAEMLERGDLAWVVIPKTDASPRRRVPTDPEKRLEWESIKAKQKELRTANNNIKTNIRKYIGLQKNADLDQKIASTRSEKYKFLLKQIKELNELILKKDYNKSEEIEARRAFIKYIRGSAGIASDEDIDRFPDRVMGDLDPKEVAEHKRKIEEAAAKKIPFEKIDAARKKKETEQRQKEREAGGIKGVVRKFYESYNSYISGEKAKEAAYHGEPFLAKYINNRKLAYEASLKNPSADNSKRLEIVDLELAQAIEEYKLKLLKVQELIKALQFYTNKPSGRYSKANVPWFLLEGVPEEHKMEIHKLIANLQSINMEFSRVMPWVQYANNISNQLKEKLEQPVQTAESEIMSPMELQRSQQLQEDLKAQEKLKLQKELEAQQAFEAEQTLDEETAEPKKMSLQQPRQGHMSQKRRKVIFNQITKQALSTEQLEPIGNVDAKVEADTKKLFMELWDKSPTRLEGER